MKDAPCKQGRNPNQFYQRMKELLVSRKVLTYYHVKKPGKIQVDLSKSGIGAALQQNDRPTAYASKFQTAKQQRYALVEQEMLVLVFGHQTIHQCTVLSNIILYYIILYYIILYFIYIYIYIHTYIYISCIIHNICDSAE